MRGKALGFVLALTMVLPAIATPVSADEEQDLERFYAERLAELQAMWEEPSGLDAAGAADLLRRSHALSDEEAFALIRFLAQAAPGASPEDAAASPAGTAFRMWYAGRLAESHADVWEENTWEDVGWGLTLAYLALGSVHSDFLPHNLRIPGIYLGLDTAAGCNGGWSSGYCYLRVTLDALGLVALDLHQTTDTAVAQYPLSVELHVHWRIVCDWIWCYPVFEFHAHTPDTVVAYDAAYVFGFPAMSGQFASRATDHEVLQMVYDDLGYVHWQKPREFTSAPLLGTTPVGAAAAPFGGTPGVADLHAVAPAPTYYGFQVPPEAPGKPAVPATPALPAGPAADLAAQARVAYAQTHLRVRDDFGTAPVDSTGPTVSFEMTQIRAWHLNLAIVRWKNVGTGTTGIAPGPPASFYYDAAWSLTGGEPNTWTKDYSIRDPLL